MEEDVNKFKKDYTNVNQDDAKNDFSEKAKEFEKNETKYKGALGAIFEDVKILFMLVGDYFSGKLPEEIKSQISWADIALILGGLAYLITPIDAIPDIIPVLGLTDDVFVLGGVIYKVGRIIGIYKEYLRSNGRL